MDKLIEIKVNGSMVTKDAHIAGAAGEGNTTRLRIEFDAGWDGYAKSITFWDALGENPTTRTLTADLLEDLTESSRIYLAYVPSEVTNIAGKIDFAIDGWANGRRRRSAYDALTVPFSPRVPVGDQIIDPTPTQAEQLQGQIENLVGDVAAEADRAETAAEWASREAQNAANYEAGAQQAASQAYDYSEKAQTQAANSAASAARAMQAQSGAQNAQAAIMGMTVSGTNVAPDSDEPMVQKSFNTNGSVNLHFNMRQGVSGVYVGDGEMPEGYNVQIVPNGERSEGMPYMAEYVTQLPAPCAALRGRMVTLGTSGGDQLHLCKYKNSQYIWERVDNLRGPQGPAGPRGEKGEAGGAQTWADLGEYEIESKVYDINSQAGLYWRGLNINGTYALVFKGTRYEGLKLAANNAEQTAWNLGGLWDVSTYPVNIFFTNVTVDADGNLMQYGNAYGTGTYFYDPNYTEFDPNADLQVFDASETGMNPLPEEYLPEIVARIKYGKSTLNTLPEGTFYFQYKDTKTVYAITEDRATVEVDLKVQNGYPVILWAGNAEQAVNTDGTLGSYSEQELRFILNDNNLAGRYFSVYEDFHDLGPGASCKVYECVRIGPDWETTGTAVLTCNSWTLSCAREDITPTITAGYVGLKGKPFKIFG